MLDKILDDIQRHVAYLGAPFMSEKTFFIPTAKNILNTVAHEVGQMAAFNIEETERYRGGRDADYADGYDEAIRQVINLLTKDLR
jgi:hypothetical protein